VSLIKKLTFTAETLADTIWLGTAATTLAPDWTPWAIRWVPVATVCAAVVAAFWVPVATVWTALVAALLSPVAVVLHIFKCHFINFNI
jgi:hypothetical protein